MNLRSVFATNLRNARNLRGMSQDDLAYSAGISRSYLSQIEKGTFNASLRIIEKLAGSLNIEPAKLLERPPAKAAKSR